MEEKSELLSSLIEGVKDYSKTTYELYKLKALEKTADLASMLLAKAVAIAVLILFFLFLSIGAALWTGDLLGKSWYGFLIMAGFYGIMGLIMMLTGNKGLKRIFGNAIIKQVLK